MKQGNPNDLVKRKSGAGDPMLISLVRYIARRAAERDYEATRNATTVERPHASTVRKS